MKKIYAILFVIAGMFLAPNLMAAITLTLYQNADSQTSAEGNGGEFTAVTTGVNLLGNYSSKAIMTTSTGQQGFETYCLEYSEPFKPGTTYSATLSSGAVNGGVGHGLTGTSTFDPLSLGTAWLYSQFATGNLIGFNYNLTGQDSNGNTRQATANLLQDAIWYLENEIATIDTSNIFYKAVLAKFGTIANAQKDANGAYDVVVLNPYNSNGQYQSQLAMVPEASTLIAGALLLLPFGLGTFRIIRKASLV